MKTPTAVILLFLVSVAVSSEEPEHPTRKFHKIVNYVNDAYNKFKNFFWNGYGSEIKYQEKTNPPSHTATNPPDDAETNPTDDAETNPPNDTETNPPNDTETNDDLDDISMSETTTPKQDWRKSTTTRTKQTGFFLCSQIKEEVCIPLFFQSVANRNRM